MTEPGYGAIAGPMITRFAPSPTGFLHLGHALAAKTAFDFFEAEALYTEKKCLLRIEDIDYTRCRPEYTQAILEDLAWLGFDWPEPVRVQSEHLSEYETVLNNLRDRGLVYRCFKTRKELPDGVYRGPSTPMPLDEEHAKLEEKQPFAWRLNMRSVSNILSFVTYQDSGVDPGLKTIDPNAYGDVVIARKDIGTSYLLACTHDDALQGVTDVVRGRDFIELTGLQRILQDLMHWPEPRYHHHVLLTNEDGEKLAKRNKDTAIRELRDQGLSPRDVLDMASRALTG